MLGVTFYLKNGLADDLTNGMNYLCINWIAGGITNIKCVDGFATSGGNFCSCDSQAVLAKDSGDIG